jgi:hypothetical protein
VPRSSCFALRTEFRERIEPVRRDLPEGLAADLDAIADLTRLTRNKAGHPAGRQIDEDTSRVHLAIAPVHPRKVQLLASHSAVMPAGARA